MIIEINIIKLLIIPVRAIMVGSVTVLIIIIIFPGKVTRITRDGGRLSTSGLYSTAEGFPLAYAVNELSSSYAPRRLFIRKSGP